MKSCGISGKVVLFGTPAEEGFNPLLRVTNPQERLLTRLFPAGGGKIRLLEAGAYSDHKVDISLISHPSKGTDAAQTFTSTNISYTAEYFGREAHAAANPWLGINALDGLISAYNSISMLRQQTMPGDLIQGHITNGGARPNIIHANAAGRFVVRSGSVKRAEEVGKKVYDCLESGALASSAKVSITTKQGYKNHIPNRPLARSYARYFNALNPPSSISANQDIDAARGRSSASTDQGNISHVIPSISPYFSIPTGPTGQGPHNPEFATTAGTKSAYDRALRVAKALAGTAIDVLVSKDFLDEVKKDWQCSIQRE